MLTKYYVDAFGITGTITPVVPDAPDPSGFMSYSQGFTFDYQRDLTSDPLAKSPTYVNFNNIFYDITLNIQDYQRWGFPGFITAANNAGTAFTYGHYAIVRYSASGAAPYNLYMSLVDGNADTPPSAKWLDLGAEFSRAYVKQGGGVGQLTNQIYIGWSSASKLKVTVDSSDQGNIALEPWSSATFLAQTGNDTLNGTLAINDSAVDTATLGLFNTASNGVNVHFVGNGSTTPGKYLRVLNGQLQFVNSAYTVSLWTLDDAGNETVAGNITSDQSIVATLDMVVHRNAAVTGTFTVGDDSGFTGGITVNGNSNLAGGITTSAITNTGPTTLDTTLSVAGAASVAGVLTAAAIHSTGNVQFDSTFTANGAVAFESRLDIADALGVGGQLNVSGPTFINALSAGSTGVTGALTVSGQTQLVNTGITGTLTVVDPTNDLSSMVVENLNPNGVAIKLIGDGSSACYLRMNAGLFGVVDSAYTRVNFQVDQVGNTVVAGTLGCQGLSCTSFHATLNAQIDGNLNVSGTTGITAAANINCSGYLESLLGLQTSGALYLGVSPGVDPVGSALAGIVISANGSIDSYSTGHAWGNAGGLMHSFFYNGTNFVGGISNTNTTTNYATSSDYRLKISVQGISSALETIAATPVHMFGWIDNVTDDPNQEIALVHGWLAHELALAVPEAVIGEKDAVDAKGKPIYQQVDQSKTTPLLWAALQEANTLIKAQAATIATMQAQLAAIMAKLPA